MEDIASLWSYQESHDELKQKLLCTTLELESVRMEANEAARKNKECVKQLLQFLKIACQERDEARDQLEKLLKIMPSSTPTPTPSELFPRLPQIQPETPLIIPTKANSSITESNSHGSPSPPVDSLLDAVSSPELSNINMADSNNLVFVSQPFVQDFTGTTVSTNVVSPVVPEMDEGSLVIDSFVKGKPLPQKGKLLQAVLEAGPLLQTLLVAGPLPRWRNPPPLQAFHVPAVSIRGRDSEILTQEAAAHLTHVPKLSSFVEMSCGSSQMLSANSVLDFAGGSCLGSGRLMPAGASNANDYVSYGKRRRFQ